MSVREQILSQLTETERAHEAAQGTWPGSGGKPDDTAVPVSPLMNRFHQRLSLCNRLEPHKEQYLLSRDIFLPHSLQV